jgi:hypothetical protein
MRRVAFCHRDATKSKRTARCDRVQRALRHRERQLLPGSSNQDAMDRETAEEHEERLSPNPKDVRAMLTFFDDASRAPNMKKARCRQRRERAPVTCRSAFQARLRGADARTAEELPLSLCCRQAVGDAGSTNRKGDTGDIRRQRAPGEALARCWLPAHCTERRDCAAGDCLAGLSSGRELGCGAAAEV